MECFYVYILKCSDGSYYTGHTDDLERRVAEHMSGIFETYTASRLPIELVFNQAFESREEAFNIERRIKGWTRRKKEALIANNMDLLIKYAKGS